MFDETVFLPPCTHCVVVLTDEFPDEYTALCTLHRALYLRKGSRRVKEYFMDLPAGRQMATDEEIIAHIQKRWPLW